MSVVFWQQWRELLPGWNWSNFDLIHVGAEWGGYKGSYFELHVGLLGFHVELEVWDEASRRKALAPIEGMRQDFLRREAESAEESSR